MNKTDLYAGFSEVIKGVYGGKPFYERVKSFLKDFQPIVKNKNKLDLIIII